MGIFNRRSKQNTIKTTILNAKLIEQSNAVLTEVNEELAKEVKKAMYAQATSNVCFVINFKGDVKASQVKNLQKEVDAIIMAKNNMHPETHVKIIVNIHSPGGAVTGYALAAAQIDRLHQLDNVEIIATVDEVAASGGYMIASVCDKIVAAPMAMVGSIGVILQMPNFKEFLEKMGISMEFYTAGKYKRTVTPFNKPTEADEEKLKEDLEYTHEVFKEHILKYRPNMNMDTVATGEVFFGQKAITESLIDEIGTFNDYILELAKDHKIIQVENKEPKKKGFFGQKAAEAVANVICDRFEKLFEDSQNPRF